MTLDLTAGTREEAVREIVGRLHLPEAKRFAAAVLAREAVHTTCMGRGVAFPHARTELVHEIVLGIGRSRAGVAFGENGELAQLIFVIGVPQRMVSDYLVCVGGLARLVRDDATRAALLAAETAPEFVELLRRSSLVLE